jgi:hypothetical protein
VTTFWLRPDEGELWVDPRTVSPVSPDASQRADAILIDYRDAARLLGISVGALRNRVMRGQVPGVIRTGRSVQFFKPTLVERLGRRASK